MHTRFSAPSRLLCPLTVAFVATTLLPGCGQEPGSAGSVDAVAADQNAAGDADQQGQDVAGADTGDAAATDGVSTDVQGGCVEGLPCDDGDPCTVDATCKDGVCVPGKTSFCTCQSDADCKDEEDGDLCNGTLFCDKGAFPYRCVVNPATVVSCAPDDPACQKVACDPTTGTCSKTNVADGAPCDDDEPCTQPGTCTAGACALGPNTCACTTDADCAPKEDGNLCNGKLYCDVASKTCVVNPATVVSCATTGDTACLKAECVPATGKCEPTPAPTKSACEDGEACTVGDYCVLGTCVSGTNTCLCTNDADCEAKAGDGDLCNGTMFCNKVNGKCELNPATVVSCPSVGDTDCQQNTCVNVFEEKGGVKLAKEASCVMVDVPDAAKKPCDDGNACTTGETCTGGACVASADICGCKSDLDCASQEDGDQCNGTLFCNKQNGKCELNPATVVASCPTVDDTDCRKRTCIPKTGLCELVAEPENKACDDDNACTQGDVCAAGSCVGKFTCQCKQDADCAKFEDGNLCNGTLVCNKQNGTCIENPASVVVCDPSKDTACSKSTCAPLTGACYMAGQSTATVCDDGDPCTTGDLCNGKGGCQAGTFTCTCKTAADCLATDDGDLCNGVPYCDTSVPGKHVCKPNPASEIHCPQNVNTQCLQNQCNPKDGGCSLQPFAGVKSCSDGDPCTSGDTCKVGLCVGGGPTDCDDGDACTTDSCDAATGCLHKQENCDDGNTCTVDACDPKTGKCDFGTTLKDGAACNADEDGCTINDTCDKGACFAGAKIKCELGGGPCDLAVCQSKGATQYVCVAAAKPDGAPCDDGQSCTLGTSCKDGSCQSSGVERLWTRLRTESGKSDVGYGAIGVLGGNLIVGGGLTERDGAGKVSGRAVTLEGWSIGAKQTFTLAQKASDAGGPARAVAVLVQDGTVGMLVGQSRAGGEDKLLALRVDAAGKQLSVTSSTVYPTLTARDATALSSGQVWVTGEAADGDDAQVMLVRLSATGQLAAKHRFPSTVGAQAMAVREIGGAHAVLAGATAESAPGKRYGWLLRSDATGAVQWQKALHQDKQPTLLTTVDAASDGAITAAGHSKKGQNWFGLIVRTDAQGAELWRRSTLSPVQIHDLLRLGSGKVLVVGAQQDAVLGEIAWLGMHDPLGNAVWSRTLTVIDGKPVQSPTRIVRVAQHEDGFALAGERTDKDGKISGLLGRVAGFGYNTCAAAGACSGKGPDGCDDGAPCTLDLCDTKTGKCVHSSLDGLVCDPADGCTLVASCKAGTCVADPNGKRWTRNFDWEDVAGGAKTSRKGADRLLPLADGGTLVFGHWQDGSKAHGALRKLDAVGQPVWSSAIERPLDTFATFDGNGVAQARVQALVERSNGEIWIVLRKPVATSGYFETTIVRFDADGDPLTDLDWSNPSGNTPREFRAMAEQPDGSTVAAYVAPLNAVWQTRGLFVRRDAKGAVVAEKTVDRDIADVVPAPQLNTILVGDTTDYTRCQPMRVGPSGLTQWSAAEFPSSASCPKRVNFCQVGRINGDELAVAMTDGCIGGYLTHAFRVIRYQLADGKFVGTSTWKGPKGSGLELPSVWRGPHGGFAFFHTPSSPTKDARLFLTDFAGTQLVERELPADANFTASAFAANDANVLWAGRRVTGSGALQTGIAHAGPWGASTCPEAGLCKAAVSQPTLCDDGNPCTRDVCATDKGCVHTKESCDDGNWCTSDACDAKAGCVNKTESCVDGDICTQDLCNALVKGADGKTGCEHPIKTDCVDGAKCTDDLCDSKTGTCSNPPKVCDDGDPCTNDGCHALYGCQTSPTQCDDDDPCTYDQCISGKGCIFTVQADGAPCEDDTVCKLGKGTCTSIGCSFGGWGLPSGCSQQKPTTSCLTTRTEGKGKLDSYVGPVWMSIDGKTTMQMCDMKAGAFWRRIERAELLPTTTMAPGKLATCAGIDNDLSKSVGWLAEVVQNQSGQPKTTIPVSFDVAVPTPHTAVRVRIVATGSGGYSALKDTLKVKVLMDGKTVFNGTYGSFANVTWNGLDAEHSNAYCEGMSKSRHQAMIDVQTLHTAATLKVALSLSSDQDTFSSRHTFHHVEIWTK
ncbi:MAG: hypothetical protein H6747_08175 [Deltaproteobacteria bacterium]|nr:hypothetical protein [Deltaproteobacteria bacterium]